MVYVEQAAWTDVVQALGTAVGAIMSTLAVAATVLLLLHEIRVRRDEKQDGEAAQARLVIPEIHSLGRDTRSGPTEKWIMFVAWRITNYSEGPVFNLTVRVEQDGNPMMPVNETATAGRREARRTILVDEPTAGHFNLDTPLDYPIQYPSGDLPKVPEAFAVIVSFTDLAGLRWSRTGTESPKRIVEGSASPRRWSSTALFTVAMTLGFVSVVLAVVALIGR